ncbi:MAG: hypothetical protein DWQ08_12845, partial [Proteobacteria bacterium]
MVPSLEGILSYLKSDPQRSGGQVSNVFRSESRRIRWPAIPKPANAKMMSVLHQLSLSEWSLDTTIRKRQAAQLVRLLAYAIDKVPYYRERRSEYVCGLDDTESGWTALPVLGRADLQQEEKRLIGDEFRQRRERVYEVSSSGSTGRPVRVLQNREVQFFWHVFTLREHFWHRRDPLLKLATIKHYRQGRHAYPGFRRSGWGSALDSMVETGDLALLNSATDVDLQVKWLSETEPAYLLTYPSNLKLLASEFIARGKSLENLRQIRCLGETVDEEVRRLTEAAWGVDVADMYSAQEVGYIALQCPDHP